MARDPAGREGDELPFHPLSAALTARRVQVAVREGQLRLIRQGGPSLPGCAGNSSAAVAHIGRTQRGTMRGLRRAVAAAWGQTRDGFLSLSGSPR